MAGTHTHKSVRSCAGRNACARAPLLPRVSEVCSVENLHARCVHHFFAVQLPVQNGVPLGAVSLPVLPVTTIENYAWVLDPSPF